MFYTSAASGVNVVRVFEEIIEKSIENKENRTDNFVKDVLDVLDDDDDFFD